MAVAFQLASQVTKVVDFSVIRDGIDFLSFLIHHWLCPGFWINHDQAAVCQGGMWSKPLASCIRPTVIQCIQRYRTYAVSFSVIMLSTVLKSLIVDTLVENDRFVSLPGVAFLSCVAINKVTQFSRGDIGEITYHGTYFFAGA